MRFTILSPGPLHLIHSDKWGPSPELSHGGFRYYLIFVKDFSRFTWIYPLVQKYEAIDYFRIFRLAVEKQFGTNIKYLQTDGGKEYINNFFADILINSEITHRITCPYTFARNGKAERHRHIVEHGLALCHYAFLPRIFWMEAICTSVYLMNITLLITKEISIREAFQKKTRLCDTSYFWVSIFSILGSYKER